MFHLGSDLMLYQDIAAAAAAAKSLQLCPTLCNPIDGSPPSSSVPGILQARILEWVAISFSNACMHAKSLQLCLTLCNPMDSSPPGSSVHGILKARILEWIAISFSNVQFSSVAQSCPTLCNPMNCSTPGLPVHHQLPEFTQTHVHRISDAIRPSHPLSSPSPPAPNPSQHQGLFQWVNSSHEVAKVLEFQLQHQSFQWTSRTDLQYYIPVKDAFSVLGLVPAGTHAHCYSPF